VKQCYLSGHRILVGEHSIVLPTYELPDRKDALSMAERVDGERARSSV